MAKILKTDKISLPKMRLIGKKYSEKDRKNGTFSEKWGEWFSKNLFVTLEEIETANSVECVTDYLAAMRVINGEFEYWIGMIFPENTQVPTGYEFADIDELICSLSWIYGNPDSGELYGLDMHNKCVKETEKLGMKRLDDSWCFEVYTCPRFTIPDEKGNVILDYIIAVEK